MSEVREDGTMQQATPDQQPPPAYDDVMMNDSAAPAASSNAVPSSELNNTAPPASNSPDSTEKLNSDVPPTILLVDSSPQPAPARGRGRGRGRVTSYNGDTEAVRPSNPPVLASKHRWLKQPYFVVLISVVQVVVFIAELIANRGIERLSVNPMIGPSAQTLLNFGAEYGPSIVKCHQWWRLLMPILVHVGIIHILINLVVQLAIGWKLEKKYGFWRIVPIYLLSGLFGNILSTLLLPQTISCGASGSIFGFLGVLFVDVVQNWKVIRHPRRQLILLIVSTVISLLMSLAPFIDAWDHIGGFLEGLVTAVIFLPNMFFWSKSGRRAKYIGVGIAVPLCLLSIIGGIVLIYTKVNVYGWCKPCRYISCLPILHFQCAYNSNGTFVC